MEFVRACKIDFWIVTNLPYIQQLTFDSPTRVEKTFIKQIKS